MGVKLSEVEYQVIALVTCELIRLKHLCQDLRFDKDKQIKLICDNQVTATYGMLSND